MDIDFHILITDRFSSESEQWLKSQPRMNCFHSAQVQPTPEELASAHALIIRSRTNVDETLLGQAPNLKVIVSATSGFDHMDLKATKLAKVVVMHTPQANAQSAAEMTWALVLGSARKIVKAHKCVKSGAWRRDELTGVELHGKNYGIVGLGRVGSKVSQMAKAFGMNVFGYDPYIDETIFSELKVHRVGFEELLRQADILSFHVPKTEETKNMLGRAQLPLLNSHAIVINTSRGSVINEADLIWALQERRIDAAGLDVFQREPLPRDSELLKFENVLLTPHIGATTQEAFHKASECAAKQTVQFLLHHKVENELPPTGVPWARSRFTAPN